MSLELDRQEAKRILDQQLSKYRTAGYTALLRLIEEPDTFAVEGPAGVKYQLEIMALWDSEEGGDLRVRGAIDDGGWRAFVPLSSDFIIRPDGTFVGE